MSRLSIGEAIQQVVGVLSDVPSPEDVLRAIARAARQMMLADEAYLLLREGGRLVLRAADGLPESLVGHSSVRLGEGIEGWVADHGEPVALSDASRERRFRDLPGREARVRALAVVPMKLRDDVVGVLATAGMDPFPPAGSRLTGLEILASIGAVAIENDRLLAQERRRAHQAEMLLDLSGIQDQELEPYLRRVAEAINAALGVDGTELLLFQESEHGGACCARAGERGIRRDLLSVELPRSEQPRWAREILSSGQPLLCQDVEQEPRLRSELRRSGVRSLLAVPIQVGGERRGLLSVANAQQGSLGAEDLTFLTLIAARVGLSVERADLSRRQLDVSREEARQQARQEFLGIASHELKTPVAVLKAYVELLMRKAEIDPSRAVDQEVLGRMLEQTDRMLAMVEQLLDLQKIEVGQFPLEIRSFDLADITRRVAESLQFAATNHRIVVRSDGKLKVMGDRRRVEEVLVNLLENAVKYSPPDSRINVTVSARTGATPDRGEALVSVEDEGIGIPTQDMERIFERFYQGRGRFHRGHVGLGLGLYIAREIVDRHGGRLWAESVEGVGSTFHFALPLVDAD